VEERERRGAGNVEEERRWGEERKPWLIFEV